MKSVETHSPQCSKSRSWMLKHFNTKSSLAFRFFSDNIEFMRKSHRYDDNGWPEDSEHVLHIRDCPECVAWVHNYVGAKIMVQQCRLSNYCCPTMYSAVEEGGNSLAGLKILRVKKYNHDFGPYEFWSIEGTKANISFCPWCGKTMDNIPVKEVMISNKESH